MLMVGCCSCGKVPCDPNAKQHLLAQIDIEHHPIGFTSKRAASVWQKIWEEIDRREKRDDSRGTPGGPDYLAATRDVARGK